MNFKFNQKVYAPQKIGFTRMVGNRCKSVEGTRLFWGKGAGGGGGGGAPRDLNEVKMYHH